MSTQPTENNSPAPATTTPVTAPVASRTASVPATTGTSNLGTSAVAKWSTYIDLVSKVVALLTWPVVLLVAVAIFYSPLRRIADLVPEKFERSNEFGIGLLSVKIQEQARASGNEELARIISGLLQASIEWLLKLGDGLHRVIGSDDGRDGVVKHYYLTSNIADWKKLEAKGLLQADIKLTEFETFFNSLRPVDELVLKNQITQEQEDRLLQNDVRLTKSGKRAYRIIIGVVADMIGKRLPSKDENQTSK